MTVDPVIKTREIPLPVAEAFELFTARLDTWWPLDTHSISADAMGVSPAAVRWEGGVGGRVVEVAVDGSECVWAEIIAWNPPERFVVAWHPNLKPTAASILEVRFSPNGAGSSLYLEHRGWDEFGERGLEIRGQYDPGWDRVLSFYETASGPQPD